MVRTGGSKKPKLPRRSSERIANFPPTEVDITAPIRMVLPVSSSSRSPSPKSSSATPSLETPLVRKSRKNPALCWRKEDYFTENPSPPHSPSVSQRTPPYSPPPIPSPRPSPIHVSSPLPSSTRSPVSSPVPEPTLSQLKRTGHSFPVTGKRKSPRVPPQAPASAQPAAKRQKIVPTYTAKGKAPKQTPKSKATIRASPPPKKKAGFDTQLFCSQAASQRYLSIRLRSFVKERNVLLKAGEFVQIQNELSRRGWNALASLPGSFNPDFVHYFYSNVVVGPSSSRAVRKSHVLGIPILYDSATIRTLLDIQDNLEEDEICEYHRLTQGEGRMLDDDMLDCLCVPGWKSGQNAILRVEMKTMTQAWLTFILANIMPSLHSSSLTTNRAILCFCILDGRTVDVATIISDAIHRVATSPDSLPLIFPALLTALIQKHGVQIPALPSVSILPPNNAQLLKQHCSNPLDDASDPAPASSSSTSLPAKLETMRIQQLEFKQQLDELQSSFSQQMEAIYRGCCFLYHHVKEAFKSTDHKWETDRAFRAHCCWPEDRPIISEEEEATAEQSEGSEESADSEMASVSDDAQAAKDAVEETDDAAAGDAAQAAKEAEAKSVEEEVAHRDAVDVGNDSPAPTEEFDEEG